MNRGGYVFILMILDAIAWRQERYLSAVSEGAREIAYQQLEAIGQYKIWLKEALR